MKTFFFLFTFALAVPLNAAESPAAGATSEASLPNLLTEFHRPGDKDSDIERPGWRDARVLQGLARVANTSTNSDEAQTAKVWLAAVEFETIQAETRREQVRLKVDALNVKLDQIINTAKNSWQGKVARMMKSNALLFGRRWDECRAEVASILQDIEGFKGEQNPQFTLFLSIQKKAPADLEAEARFLLVIVSALEKDFESAIKQTGEIRARYPKWSEKEKLDGVAEFLRRGICPFQIP